MIPKGFFDDVVKFFKSLFGHEDMKVISTSTYRHRGFHCKECNLTKAVFGVGPIPNCGHPLTIEWDHVVHTITYGAK